MQRPEVPKDLIPAKGLSLEIGFTDDETELRSKTSLRMLYEAQSAVIQKQIGDLETVRSNLGLSQRKIAQLLLVDPSSWTRWTRKGDQVPPHIWRALQWYLTLKEKIPGLTPQYFIGQDPKVLHEKALQKISEETQRRLDLERRLSAEINHLEKRNQKDRRILIFSLGLSALLGMMFLAALLRI